MPVVYVPAKYETSANSGPQPTWGGARLATTANVFVNYTSQSNLIDGIGITRVTQRVGIDYVTYRTFLFFDNFGIPSGSTINSITLNVYNLTFSGGIDVQVVKSLAFGGNGSSNFIATDYNDWLDTNIFPPLPYDTYGIVYGWLVTGYNSIPLTSVAISDATADGYLNLVLVERTHDWSNNAPSSDMILQGGVTYKGSSPIELIIDYTAPSNRISVINDVKSGRNIIINSVYYPDISKINDGDAGL